MNEVSTSIVVHDERGILGADGAAAGLRFVRTTGGGLRVGGAFAVGDRNGGVLFSSDDAIALRDWLNEEFGDAESDGGGDDYVNEVCGVDAAEMPYRKTRGLLGSEDGSIPQKGCRPCAMREDARV